MKHSLYYERIGYEWKTKALKTVFRLLLLCCMVSCSDNDSYYDRPSWLEKPIYDVLKEKGNFKMYLEAADRTLYSSVLKGSGNYTVFAPNDDAFKKYLTENGYTSVEAIPVDELTKIIGYSLVYNKFEAAHLGDALISKLWEEGTSIKKRTSYYGTLYKEAINGVEQWVANGYTDVSQVQNSNYYKYLPIYTSSYFDSNGLSADDYTIFYPASTYTGLNVQGGRIVNSDIYAENGIIHEVDIVSYPLLNLDESLKKDENGTAFRNILETKVANSYLFIDWVEAPLTTEVYKKLYPDRNITEVYLKSYNSLPFNPNYEYYSGALGTSEQAGFTYFIPSNAAVETFTTELKERARVDDLSSLSKSVLGYFLNAHMVNEIVWPSNFKKSMNANGEFINGKGLSGVGFAESGVTKSTFASNGVKYNIDHVIKSKYFNTVYSEVLLNPDYKMAYYAYTKFFANSVVEELLKSPITGYLEENYTILLPSDELLKADGYTYNENDNTFANSSKLGSSMNADDRLKRLLQMCVFKRIKNDEVNTEIANFAGSPSLGYGGYAYAVNDYGDMIRFKDNKIQAVGNILDGDEVTATELKDFAYNNGRVFGIDKMLQFSPRTTKPTVAEGWEDQTIYAFLTKYVTDNPDGKLFKDYLDKLTLYNATDQTITGISKAGFYTVLVPTKAAIEEAVASGLLPALNDVLLTDENQSKAYIFVMTHFLSGVVIPDDGTPRIDPGNYETLSMPTSLKITVPEWDLVSTRLYVNVAKQTDGTLKFTPRNYEVGTTVAVEGVNNGTVVRDVKKSNVMGPRAVIHAIDHALLFKINPKQ
ncbi:MAG TPA: fasciclin domain-containing protein [Bacteroides reticulotermitis]|nr:fasciclin domain-containing protein [Bacteroides reticulotermitis]